MVKTENQTSNVQGPAKLGEAIKTLREAEKAYDKLVKLDVSTMEDRSGHLSACQKALEAKRTAQKAVEDLKLGKA